MQVSDHLQNLSEQKMKTFLEKKMGAKVKSVIKFYDEAYSGYVFQVKLDGLTFLPREDGGYLRFGKFGLIKDDEKNPIPTSFDNFEEMLKHPNFLKSYVLFVDREIGDDMFFTDKYMDSFKKSLSYYLAVYKNRKKQEVEDKVIESKQLLNEIVDLASEPEKE